MKRIMLQILITFIIIPMAFGLDKFLLWFEGVTGIDNLLFPAMLGVWMIWAKTDAFLYHALRPLFFPKPRAEPLSYEASDVPKDWPGRVYDRFPDA